MYFSKSFFTIAAAAFVAELAIASAIPFGEVNGQLIKRVVSPDETCGGTKGYTCGASNVGPCCSQYGWCGATTDHCGTGCQLAFGLRCGTGTSTVKSTTTSKTTTSKTTTKTTSKTTTISTSSTPVPTGSPDETCGMVIGAGEPGNGYSCGASNAGPCCSQYGYCGSTDGHCGTGCQLAFGLRCGTGSGTTTTSTTTTPPAPTGTNISTNGRCGPANGNKICPNSQCCSASGWCGTAQEYCQSPDCLLDFGRCDADATPSGANTASVPRPYIGNVPYAADIYVCESKGKVALTYDDGPYLYTDDLLNILASYNAKATFFVTGVNNGKGQIDDESTPYPAILRRMIAEGHQIASHTWSHADLSAVSETRRRAEMTKLEMAVRNVIGKFPTYMRPPYSSCNAACMQTMAALGYHVTYFDLDTQDYLHITPELVPISLNVVDSFFGAGISPANTDYLSIMHDIHYTSVHQVTVRLLDNMKRLGFKGVTVGECLNDPEANWYRAA